MKIVAADRGKHKVKTDLARLSNGASEIFLSTMDVRRFLAGKTRLDYTTANAIAVADRAVTYIERFSECKIRVKRVDHIIALLCLFSEDSFGTGVLSPEFHMCQNELQAVVDSVISQGYSGVRLAIEVMDFILDSDFLYGRSPAPIFLVYNLFLFQDGCALVLEDTDMLDASLVPSMRYKVEGYYASRA